MASAAIDSPLDESRSRSGSFIDDQEQDDADLFGDEDADDVPTSHRKLDDSELDSGDDLERNDRREDDVEDTQDFDDRHAYTEKKFLPKTIGRLNAPEADNEEVRVGHLINTRKRADTCSALSPEHASVPRPPAKKLQPKNLQATNRTPRWKRPSEGKILSLLSRSFDNLLAP
jgi:hypothetical protein